jgi:hypothetical protein
MAPEERIKKKARLIRRTFGRYGRIGSNREKSAQSWVKHFDFLLLT